jgi:hypothetical protein
MMRTPRQKQREMNQLIPNSRVLGTENSSAAFEISGFVVFAPVINRLVFVRQLPLVGSRVSTMKKLKTTYHDKTPLSIHQ